MSLSDEIERAALDRAVRQRNDHEQKAAQQRLIKDTDVALQRLGNDVVNECRKRNRHMVGSFDVHGRNTLFSGRRYRFNLTNRGWLIGDIFVDESGKFHKTNGSDPRPWDRLHGDERGNYEKEKARALNECNLWGTVAVTGPLSAYLRSDRLFISIGYEYREELDLMQMLAELFAI